VEVDAMVEIGDDGIDEGHGKNGGSAAKTAGS
jgi:hypothetical protein